jgi:hypothetical protein
MADAGQDGKSPESSSDEIKRRDVAAGYLKVHEAHKTARTVIICVTIVLVVWIVGWVLIRIYTHDIWLEVVVILFGPSGIVTVWLTIIFRRWSKKVDDLKSKLP